MNKEIICNIITILENSINTAQDKDIRKENFKKIQTEFSKEKIAFIDGGNAEILSAADFSLQFIRVYATIYKHNKRIKTRKEEFYLLIQTKTKDKNIIYTTQTFPLKEFTIENLEIDSTHNSIAKANKRASISSAADMIRRFAELKLAEQIASETDIITLDGNLETTYPNEDVYLKQISDKAVALSKTSELFTEQGTSFLAALNKLGPENEWYYHTDTKNNINSYIIKLNKKSKYVFKLDTYSKETSTILNLLINNSIDPVFLGYPYGLIEADRFARITNQEKSYLKTRFLVNIKDSELLNKHLNALNAHSVLDNVS